jgi:hypothetical protein
MLLISRFWFLFEITVETFWWKLSFFSGNFHFSVKTCLGGNNYGGQYFDGGSSKNEITGKYRQYAQRSSKSVLILTAIYLLVLAILLSLFLLFSHHFALALLSLMIESTHVKTFCSISSEVAMSIVVFPFFEFISCELALLAILFPLVCFQARYDGASGKFPRNGEICPFASMEW